MPAATTKKSATKKRATPGQTTLVHLLKLTEAHGAAIDNVLVQLTELRKTPPSIVVQSGSTAPAETSNANARLGALLAIISGKGAQQLLEDMLSAGRPPSAEKLLHLADDHLARNGVPA